MSDRSSLESVFKVDFIKRKIRGDVEVSILGRGTEDNFKEYRDEASQAMAREALLTLLTSKRLRDATREKLAERLDNFQVSIDPDKHPQMRKALRRLSDGETSTDLTWPLIQRAYEIYKNAATHLYKFDPTAALNGELDEDGMIEVPNFSGAAATNCAEMEDFSYTESVMVEGEDGLPRLPTSALDAVMENEQQNIWAYLLSALGRLFLYFFFKQLADFFKRFRNTPVIKKTVRKWQRWCEQQAAKQLCIINGGDPDECGAAAEAAHPYPPEDDEEYGEGEDAGGEPVTTEDVDGMFGDMEQSGVGVDCVTASHTVLTYVQNRSATEHISTPVTPDEDNSRDWTAILQALMLQWADTQLASNTEFLLATSDFGPEDANVDDDTTVIEAVDELRGDVQQNPAFRIRYYGSKKDRWTDNQTP